MKHLLQILLVLLTVSVQAQLSISVQPVEAHIAGSTEDTDIEVYATVTNTSAETVNLLWTRREVEKPESWWTWICDLRNCYEWDIGAAPASRVNTLAPGESMEFQVHARAFGEAGFAQVEVDLFDSSDTTNILGTVRTTFEASASTATNDPQSVQNVRLYPNPASDYFRVFQGDKVDQIEVYSVVGNQVRTYKASKDGRYDVSGLAEGMYLVRLMQENGSVLKTVRLSKN